MNKRHLLKVALLLIILLLTYSILFTISNAEENRCEDIETLGEPTYSEKVVVKTRNMVKSRVLSANSEISPSKQTSHSKADIIQKFNEAKYTLTNETTYETEPILAGPNYREGTLTSLARQDTLKQLNFYRYLAGVNDVTIYEEMLSNNAKGSVLLSVSNFSHYPSKPADMSEEFYKYALYGTSYPPYSLSGYSSSGNIAEGTNMVLPKSIKGYMDDTFNVVSNSVGHRLSIMCPYAQKTSFGCAPSSNYENVTCSTVTMYNQFGMTTEDTYYTWPPAGYCPIEVTDSNEMWSITLGGNLSYNTSNMEITLKCDGKEYRIDNSKILDSSCYNSFYFSLPEELIRIIDGGDFYLSGKKVEVDIKNGVYQGSEVIDLSYSTEFFSVEPIPVTYMKI